MIAGYSWSNFDVSAPVPDEDPFDRNQSFDVEGGLVGVEAGWNHQMDSLVLGMAADIAVSGAKDESVYDVVDEDEFYIGELQWLATLRAKLGFAADNVLFYATGGLAVTDARLTYEDRADPPFERSESETLLGWTAGGGIEVALGEIVSVKAEYLYADFGKLDGNFDLTGDTREADIDTHIARGGVNFHF